MSFEIGTEKSKTALPVNNFFCLIPGTTQNSEFHVPDPLLNVSQTLTILLTVVYADTKYLNNQADCCIFAFDGCAFDLKLPISLTCFSTRYNFQG